jgi:molecular chaperone IbpA
LLNYEDYLNNNLLNAKELNKMTLFDDIYGRTFPFAIGFDRTFQLLERASQAPSVSYPPYNIVKEDDEHFSIELAVAGFDKKEISVSKEKEVLSIEGVAASSEKEFVHKGLASREFRRSFTLADDVDVGKVKYENGILTIALTRVIPEADKAVEYKIS